MAKTGNAHPPTAHRYRTSSWYRKSSSPFVEWRARSCGSSSSNRCGLLHRTVGRTAGGSDRSLTRRNMRRADCPAARCEGEDPNYSSMLTSVSHLLCTLPATNGRNFATNRLVGIYTHRLVFLNVKTRGCARPGRPSGCELAAYPRWRSRSRGPIRGGQPIHGRHAHNVAAGLCGSLPCAWDLRYLKANLLASFE